MISNLESARALIQADLDHARSVVALWTDQVSELEKALEQISVVGNSRTALRGAYQGQQGSMPALSAENKMDGKAKRGRKPKQATAEPAASTPKKQRAAKSASPSASSKASESSSRAAGHSPRGRSTPKGKTGAGAAKYRDPSSGKTWTGHGRRPGWLRGTPEQYAIDHSSGTQGKSSNSDNGGGADVAGIAQAAE